MARVNDMLGAPLWRSLDAEVDSPAFREFVEAEFPSVALLAAGPDRRRFLKLMAASFALAGLSGCGDGDGRSQEVPYVRNPEHLEPGAPLSYASIAMLDGLANGVVVSTVNGRPIKVEGNQQHPWSRGGTDVFGQASVLGLYDPARSQSVRYLGRISSWESFRGAMTGRFAALRALNGRGLRLLTGPVTSPSLAAQIAATREAFPEMHWHSADPATGGAAYQGTQLAFGRRLETRWRFDRARVVVALDGDFLDPGPQQVGVSRDWIEARHAAAAHGALPEMHAAVTVPNLTSAKADHTLVAGPSAVAALADELLVAASGQALPTSGGQDGEWRARAAAALLGAKGAGIVLAGASQPATVHAAVARLNAALGNLGQTVFHTEAVAAETESLAALAEAMDRGEVQVLLMLDTNPAYDAPGDLRFSERLGRVALKIHAGGYMDETAAYADWHLPLAHPLESWGDARSPDGTVGLMQPTISPLYGGRSAPEILSLLTDAEPRSGLDLLRAHWQGEADEASFAPRWQQALVDGFLPDTALPEVTVQLAATAPTSRRAGAERARASLPPGPDRVGRLGRQQRLVAGVAEAADQGGLGERDLRQPEPGRAGAGQAGRRRRGGMRRQAGRGAGLGPSWAGRRHAGDDAGLRAPGAGPAQRRASATTPTRCGRAPRPGIAPAPRCARPGAPCSSRRRRSTTPCRGTTSSVSSPSAPRRSATTRRSRSRRSTRRPIQSDGRAWGMVIDLNSCIGCNACVVACQAENNIPVVGREEVAIGRDMHWLRIDRYYQGPADDPATHFQPVPCMHCEQAPCEVGCPVEATLHDHEGLNLMVYNRCVGTRACSGYCPYKVRRFNYLDYTANTPLSAQQQRNPDVSVRGRGVMEKCTYCVQRIAEARIQADKGDGVIPDGAVQTACQGACPTRAITFGDLADAAERGGRGPA